MSEIDSKFHDTRLAQRAMRRGHLSPKAYERHLKSLPDSAENAVPIEAEMEAVELDEPSPKRKRARKIDDGD
jgi:hypothetical protein